MASDFQRPSSWMMLASMPAQRTEGSGAAGAEAAGADEAGVDPRGGEVAGGAAEGVRDVAGRDVVGVPRDVVVGVDGGVGGSPVVAEVGADAQEGLDGAEASVGSGEVADLLASDSVLLVGERKGSPQDAAYVHVIQRRVKGREQVLGSVEVDVAKLEGLGPTSARAGEVFSGPEEPEESNDGEVKCLLQPPEVGVGCSGV